MTPLQYPAGGEARAIAAEAEILRTLALCARHGQQVAPELLAGIADRLAAAARRTRRIERALDEIAAEAMHEEQMRAREDAIARALDGVEHNGMPTP